MLNGLGLKFGLKAFKNYIVCGVHGCAYVCEVHVCVMYTRLQSECPNTCVQSRRWALVTSVISLRLIQDLSLNLEFMWH